MPTPTTKSSTKLFSVFCRPITIFNKPLKKCLNRDPGRFSCWIWPPSSTRTFCLERSCNERNGSSDSDSNHFHLLLRPQSQSPQHNKIEFPLNLQTYRHMILLGPPPPPQQWQPAAIQPSEWCLRRSIMPTQRCCKFWTGSVSASKSRTHMICKFAGSTLRMRSFWTIPRTCRNQIRTTVACFFQRNQKEDPDLGPSK